MDGSRILRQHVPCHTVAYGEKPRTDLSVFGMYATSRSEQNKFTEDIAYAQERSQSESQHAQITKSNTCNILVFRHTLLFMHILEQSETLRKSYYHQNRTTIISFGSHLLYFTDGDIHQEDYFIFLGLQVILHDLQPIFLKGTVGIVRSRSL